MELEVNDLTKRYGQKLILNHTSFTFKEGKIYGLIGRNGVGKTTFFNCLNHDVEVDSGTFMILDQDQKRTLEEKDIGYVLSTPIVPEFLTGKEFLQFFLEINEGQIKNKKTIEEYFELVKLDQEDQNKLLKEYSHGMKNKIQMLIHLIADAKILLLDEPLTSLDIVVQDDMKKLLKAMKKDHFIIFSTHILELALDLCDEIIILNNQKLELIEKKNLNTKSYKDKIIQALKDDKND